MTKKIKRGAVNPPLKKPYAKATKNVGRNTKENNVSKEPTKKLTKPVPKNQTTKKDKQFNTKHEPIKSKGTPRATKSGKTVLPKSKIIKAVKIVYSQNEINKLRQTVRSPSGHFLKRSDYEQILERAQNEKESIDEIKIEIMRENPNIRLIEETTNQTLHFQTGNFIDRLEDDGNEVSKRANFTITDFKGDEINTKSKTKLTEELRNANNIINEVINHINENIKLPKGKKLSIYVTIPETIKSNSDGKVISIDYDFSNLEVQGIDKKTFDFYLRDLLD